MGDLLIVYREGPKNGRCERATAPPQGAAIHVDGGWYRPKQPATRAQTFLGEAMELFWVGDSS